MKHLSSLRRGLLALALGLAALPAWADDDCNAPMDRWQSRDAVRQMAIQKGWQIQRLKIDDGCYEIRGTDAGGRRFKAKINPQTLEPVEMKVRDHDPNSDRDRDRDGGVFEALVAHVQRERWRWCGRLADDAIASVTRVPSVARGHHRRDRHQVAGVVAQAPRRPCFGG